MISSILTTITSFIIQVISTLGYPGIALLMAIQTIAIPMPSEVIIPFAGSLVAAGRFTLLGVSLAGALGSCIGASIAYYIGYKGGRPLVQKYGKYILISAHDLEMADRFLQKHGAKATFIGMMLPVFRSFISFPAGISRVNFKKFLAYVFFGSLFWSLLLGYLGMKLGENWATLREKFKGFDVAIVVFIVLLAALWIYRHFRNRSKNLEAGI